MSLSAIVQHKSAIAGPARQTIQSSVPVLVTGLSIDITPQYSDSIILVKANIVGNHNHVTSFAVYRDGAPTLSTSGYTNNNYPNMQATSYKGFNNTNYIEDFPIMHYEDVGSTATRTYSIYGVATWSTVNYVLYINNRASNNMASFSYMEVFEVRN